MPLEVMKKFETRKTFWAAFFLLFDCAAGGEGWVKVAVRLHAVFPAREGAEGTAIN